MIGPVRSCQRRVRPLWTHGAGGRGGSRQDVTALFYQDPGHTRDQRSIGDEPAPETPKSVTCDIICWSLAGIAGLAIAVGLSQPLPMVVVGLAVTVGFGVLLQRYACGAAADNWGPFEGLKDAPGRDAETPAPATTSQRTDPAPRAAPQITPSPEANPQTAKQPAPDVTTSTRLPGEEALASKKGSWRYDPGTA